MLTTHRRRAICPLGGLCRRVLTPLAAVVLALGSSAHAQTDVELILERDSLAHYSPEDRYDHSYLQDLSGYLTPRAFLLQNNQPFGIELTEQPIRRLSYWTNLPFSVGGGLFYRWLGVQVGFPVQGFAAPTEERGRTRSLILAANVYLRRFGIDAHYTQHNGYYLENARDVLGLSTPPYPVRADISTQAFGANFYYVFNHRRFSFRAAFIQTERQLRSAGSLLLMPTFNYYRVTGDSALTAHAGLTLNPSESIAFSYGRAVSAGLTFGYAHSFVIRRHWFALVAVLPGFTAGTNRIRTPAGEEFSRERINLRGHLRLAAGYNGPRWFVGLSSTNDLYDINFARDLRLNYLITRTYLFVGRRFEMPRMLGQRGR